MLAQSNVINDSLTRSNCKIASNLYHFGSCGDGAAKTGDDDRREDPWARGVCGRGGCKVRYSFIFEMTTRGYMGSAQFF